jgi:hypothetical protein
MQRITALQGLPHYSPPPQIPLDARRKVSGVRAVHGTHVQSREIDVFKAIRFPAHDSFSNIIQRYSQLSNHLFTHLVDRPNCFTRCHR